MIYFNFIEFRSEVDFLFCNEMYLLFFVKKFIITVKYGELHCN